MNQNNNNMYNPQGNPMPEYYDEPTVAVDNYAQANQGYYQQNTTPDYNQPNANQYGAQQTPNYNQPNANQYGAQQTPNYNQPNANQYGAQQAPNYNQSYANQYGAQQGYYNGGAPQYGQVITEKVYRENYSPTFKKDLKTAAIITYVCSGIAAAVNIAVNPFGFIDLAILLGLSLGMHLGKSKGCAIALLIVSIIESAIGIALTGMFTGWLWIVAGITAVGAFTKAKKQYQEYLNQVNQQQMYR